MRAANKRKRGKTALIPCGWSGCSKQVNSDWQLNGHIAEYHLAQFAHDNEDEDCECPWQECDFKTKSIMEMRRHIYYHGYYAALIVQGEQELECNPSLPKCNAPARVGHIVPELKDNFHCEWTDCECTFASIVEFQDHIVQHASFEYEINKSPDDKRPKARCNWGYCHKQLDNKYRLIEHICTHSNKKHAACHHCGELFRTKTTLFDHLRRQPENNTQKFQCAQCYKYFATKKLLNKHLVKHVNCYKCSMCDMTCSSASSLATHVRYRHLKDKPFKCTKCDHRSVRQNDLLTHMQYKHSKEMHHCEQQGCNYQVRSYHLLRRHFLEVHADSPFIYMCHCCDKLFKTGKSLSAHLIKKHDFQLPSGHKRFTYRVDENGYYRLETMRIESLEVTKQILSSPNPFETTTSDITQDSTCYEIVSKTNEQNERIIVSNDANEARLVGEVVISLPEL